MGCFGVPWISSLRFLDIPWSTGHSHRPITKCLAHHGNPFWSLCPFNSILPILFVKKIGLGFFVVVSRWGDVCDQQQMQVMGLRSTNFAEC